jgi:hypothetical protein
VHRSEPPFGSCIPTGARDRARKKKGAGSSSALASASRQTPSATKDSAVRGPKEPRRVVRKVDIDNLLVIECKGFLHAR